MVSLIIGIMMGVSVLGTGASDMVHEPLGQFEVTAYAGDGITAKGTVPRPYKTVAVDPDVIPYGTTLYIEGVGEVVAEDCGGAIVGKRLDLYLPSVGDCIEWGRQKKEVWLVH